MASKVLIYPPDELHDSLGRQLQVFTKIPLRIVRQRQANGNSWVSLEIASYCCVKWLCRNQRASQPFKLSLVVHCDAAWLVWTSSPLHANLQPVILFKLLVVLAGSTQGDESSASLSTATAADLDTSFLSWKFAATHPFQAACYTGWTHPRRSVFP